MNFVAEVLVELQSMGHSQASIERVLGLPMQTLTTQAENPEIIAIMHILKLYPWMLEVVERNYDPKVAKQQAVYNAGQTLSRMAKDIK